MSKFVVSHNGRREKGWARCDIEPLVLVFVAYKDLQCLAKGRTSVEFAAVGLVDFLQEFVQTRGVGLVSTRFKMLGQLSSSVTTQLVRCGLAVVRFHAAKCIFEVAVVVYRLGDFWCLCFLCRCSIGACFLCRCGTGAGIVWVECFRLRFDLIVEALNSIRLCWFGSSWFGSSWFGSG